MKILVDTLSINDLSLLNEHYLLYNNDSMKILDIWQEHSKIVLIAGTEYNIPRNIEKSERFDEFKKRFSGFYITDLSTIINTI